MKAVSGLMSRMRCRNGAKSGLASGMRIDSTIWPPSSVKRCLNAVSASVPGAHSLTSVTTRLLPFLAAHSPMIHDGCDLGLGDERTIGKHGRRDAAGDDVDLVVDDHLLHEPARVVGHAGIVTENDFDLLAGDHVAVVLHVEPRAGGSLPTRGSKTGAG